MFTKKFSLPRYCLLFLLIYSGANILLALAGAASSQTGDTTPPQINSLEALNVTNQKVTVKWKTNEPADSMVEYGTTTAYGNTFWRNLLNTNHSVNLAGLTPGTRYNFRVKSRDAAGNLRMSRNLTFKTDGSNSQANNKPPSVSATASAVSGVAPLNISFTAKGSDPDGSIVSYKWVFGDGKTASGDSVNNIYQKPGKFVARVIAKDNKGATARASIVIPVSNPTQASNPPQTIAISSLSLNPASVLGGVKSQGKVTLTGAAPSGGIVVSLLGSNIATVPASITIPAGASNKTFEVTTNSVTVSTSVVLSATHGNVTKSATLTLTAPPVPSPTVTSAGGKTYYVSPSGSDSNPGTEALPFKSIQKAADIVNPGDTVLVGDGVYTMGATMENCNPSTAVVCLSRGGNANNRVTFRSRNKWGAKIDGENNRVKNGFRFATNEANYINVEGFDVYGMGNDGSSSGFEIYHGGRHVSIIGNRIHHVGRLCANTGNGMTGIYINGEGSVNVVVDGNLIHDIGRFGQGENGCNPQNQYWQNHDHGIYHSQGDDVTVSNNIIYNIQRGWGIHAYSYNRARARYINNVFSGPNPYREGHIIISGEGMTNSEIKNNIFHQPKDAAIRIDTNNMSNTVISNNLTTVANVIYTTDSPNMTLQNNYISVDPKFVNPAGLDFHLQSGSVAIDTGSTVNLTKDYDGRPRPQGNGYDIGAFEFSSNISSTSSVETSPVEKASGAAVESPALPAVQPPATTGSVSSITETLKGSATLRRIVRLLPVNSIASVVVITALLIGIYCVLRLNASQHKRTKRQGGKV